MKGLGESLALSTQNFTLFPLCHLGILVSSLSFHLCSHGPYNAFWEYSQISSAQIPICISTASSSLVRSKPSSQVPKSSTLPSCPQHIIHRGGGGYGKSKELSQPTSAQAGSCVQPSILKRTRPFLICGISSSDITGRCFSHPPPRKSLHVAKLHQLPPGPLMRVLLTSIKDQPHPTELLSHPINGFAGQTTLRI